LLGLALRRLLVSLPLLWAISVVVFLMGHLLPGDPVQQFLGANNINDPALVARIRAEYGLDQPLPVQYARWAAKALRGDFGLSITAGAPVQSLLWQGIGNTARIAVFAVLLVVVVGWTLGVVAAVVNVHDAGGPLDRVLGLAPIVMLSIPAFSLAVVLIYFVAIRWALLPTSGMSDPRLATVDPGDLARHMVLPTLTLAWPSVGANWRLARNTVVEVLREDYVRTAYAKGLPERAIYFLHALRNSLIPLVTSAGLLFGSLLSGSFILEYIFNWPGIGSLMVNAVLNRDYPVVQGGTLVLAATYLAVNLAVDLTYAIIDPRIRYG
jgi:peptide/nickel transport system permease protein